MAITDHTTMKEVKRYTAAYARKRAAFAGDLLYNYEHEPHAFVNETDEEFVFVEFFVPGPCETVWPPGANLCAWLPTGVDTEGREPSRNIGYHVHGQDDEI